MSTLSWVVENSWNILSQGNIPGGGIGNSVGAGSPFTTYTAGVLVYGILVGFLVSVLLIGAFLILNLGLLSKRREDRIGNRTPSDVGLLKYEIWPDTPYESRTLPAEEDEVLPKRTA
jgi:hypothetical protein